MTDIQKASEDEKSAAALIPASADNPEPTGDSSSPNHGPFLEADAENNNLTEDDASDRATSVASSSTSLSSSILQHRLENGRSYHKYKDGKYLFPNDERENDRLDLQHNLYLLTLNYKLGLAPPNKEGSVVKRVLDIGTGTGLWAIEFADEHPEAEVLGVDLSPVQTQFVPPNLKFEVDDIEQPWTFSRPFDYIHIRGMTSSISDWLGFFKQAYSGLTPGGYIELFEGHARTQLDDGTLTADHAAWQWADKLDECFKILGRPFVNVPSLIPILKEAGFVDVTMVPFKWPVGPWAKDPHYKELGEWALENSSQGLEAWTMAALTRALDWSNAEVQALLAQVRKDLKDRSIHHYTPIIAPIAQPAVVLDDQRETPIKSSTAHATSPETAQNETADDVDRRDTISVVPEQRAESFQAKRFADKTILSGWFPQIKSDENSSWRIWFSRRSRALMVQIGIIGFILMTNLGVTIFAVKSYGSRNGVGLIYEGDCSTVKRLDQWLHLLINLLGTGMLSASNYCMQLQAAPTRENVNAAHAKHKWLDIGIPSLRNLKYLSMWRRCSWALLALTSIPIHLIYNSAVFQSLSSHNYTVVVVKDSFLSNASWSLKTAENNRAGDYGWEDTRVNPSNLDYEEVVRAIQRNASIYEERNISACFDLYDDYFNPQGNAIILVKNESSQSPPEDSLLMYVSIVPRSDDWSKNMWALGNGTGHFAALSPPKPVTKWFLGPPYYEVSRCIVQQPEGLSANCRFEYSPPIMFTICIMNMIKAAIMLSIWALRRWQNPKKQNQAKEVLYTLGDAIASFMREPCKQTIDMGLATKYDFVTTRRLGHRFVRSPPTIFDGKTPPPRKFEKTPKQWRSSASLRRWTVMLVM
ncbi:hypothetical protein Landi51_07799 [Colletotrichum acutatum]